MDDHLSFVTIILLTSLSCETVDLIQRCVHFVHPVIAPAIEVIAMSFVP